MCSALPKSYLGYRQWELGDLFIAEHSSTAERVIVDINTVHGCASGVSLVCHLCSYARQLAILPKTRRDAANLNAKFDPTGRADSWMVVGLVVQDGSASKPFKGTIPWDTGVVGLNMYDDFGVTSTAPVFHYTPEFGDGSAAATGRGQRVRPGDVLLEVR